MGYKVLLPFLKCNYGVKNCFFIELFLMSLYTTNPKTALLYMKTRVLFVVALFVF